MTAQKSVLIIGADPEKLDFSDPAFPPGLDAAKIMAGLRRSQELMAAEDLSADLCLIDPAVPPEPEIALALAARSYDCVVIGAGLRAPPQFLGLFEAVVNAVHRHAPGAAIAFNASPEDSAAAARRWV
jgi:hypothetical protein